MNNTFTHRDPSVALAMETLFNSQGHRFDLRSLDAQTVKKTYHELLFKNHPDRANALGMSKTLLTERTLTLTKAYETILSYLAHGGSVRQSDRYANRQPRSSKTMAQHPCLFAEYLLMRHVITAKQFFQALAWQKSERPYYGRLARDLGLLTDTDTALIVKSRRRREKFGETARRMGLLSEEQHASLLMKQRAMEPKIGQFFIVQGILSNDQLDRHLAEHLEYREQQSYRRSRASATA